MKLLLFLAALMIALAGCSGQGQPTSRSRSAPAQGASGTSSAATPAAELPSTAQVSGPMLAVLEGAYAAKGAQADRVAIVGLDGVARAEATFQPRKAPFLGNVSDVLQSQAQVGDAGVYYIDGYGVVRLLKPSGESTVVATFAMTPEQHEVWYAVSRDGSRLLAGVLAAPAVGPAALGQPWPSLVGSWKFDLEIANAGGPTRVLQHVESAQHPDLQGSWTPSFPVGWTQGGPIVMVGASIATQNAWWGGPLFTIDGDGRPMQRIAGSDCTAASVLPSGLVPCITTGFDTRVTVRDTSGRVLWKPSVDGFNALQLRLSPAGDAISDGVHAATRAKVVALPDGFRAQGWIDSQTVVGRQGDGNLSYIRLDAPGVLHDLGFKGDFVGVLPSRV